MTKAKVYLALGTNLGDRLEYINSAIDLLKVKISDLEASKIYETKPWGVTDQPLFLNTCVGGFTDLSPKELLNYVKNIELSLGRKKRIKWGPREIDIDILFYGNEVVNETELTVPHKHLSQRSFVLVPLSDIAPEFKHPVTGQTVSEMVGSIDHEDLTVFIKT